MISVPSTASDWSWAVSSASPCPLRVLTPNDATIEYQCPSVEHESGCPDVADFVAKVENRSALKISRKPIFGLLCCCIAFQRGYEGPCSILDETIWSLTSPGAQRISGSKNFRSPPQKDFCNKIGAKRSLRCRC